MRDAPLVLVVDDEDDSRIFLSALLVAEGYRVATCANGFEALRYLARARPDLVITDVRMPEMEGLELLTRIKSAAPGVPVVLCSAYADWPLFQEAMARGAEDVFFKPLSNEDLLHTVESLVGAKP